MLIVRKTDAGAYVELASSDPILEQVDVTYAVPKEVLEDGEVLASTVPTASTAVLRHDWDWARAADAETLAGLGYWRLNQVDAPPGKRQIGYTIEDQDGAPVLVPEYEDLPAPPPVPATIPDISFRQFVEQAFVDGKVSELEADAMADGRIMPATIAAVYEGLPEEQKPSARFTWKLMQTIQRNHPLTVLVSAAFGMDDAATDAFFRAAAQR